jgi:hypothetical protein
VPRRIIEKIAESFGKVGSIERHDGAVCDV